MKPNAEGFEQNVEYFTTLVMSTGLTQKELAARLGCTDRAIRTWISGQKAYTYCTLFALECLVLSV